MAPCVKSAAWHLVSIDMCGLTLTLLDLDCSKIQQDSVLAARWRHCPNLTSPLDRLMMVSNYFSPLSGIIWKLSAFFA
jgi:hypothetical protein